MPRRCTPLRQLSLEKLIRGRALRLLLRLVGFEPRDLLVEQRDALVEFLDRQQRQVLPDLVRDLLLRPVVLIDRWHGRASALTACQVNRPTASLLPVHPPATSQQKDIMAENQFRFDDGAAYE